MQPYVGQPETIIVVYRQTMWDDKHIFAPTVNQFACFIIENEYCGGGDKVQSKILSAPNAVCAVKDDHVAA